MLRKFAVALILCAFLGLVGYGVVTFAARYRQITVAQVCTVDADGWEVTLSTEQARNASIIVAESVARELPEEAAVVALATAYQESGLRNIDYGDRDSVGLFQQRPSQGWGSLEEIMDPWYSSGAFYAELVTIDWQALSVNDAAQAVQRSGFPEAYAKHEGKARAVAAALRGSRVAALSCINFEPPSSPSPATFERVLEALGVAAEVREDGAYVLRAADEPMLWAGAQHVVASTHSSGVTRVQLPGHSWDSGTEGWSAGATNVDPLTAVVTLG